MSFVQRSGGPQSIRRGVRATSPALLALMMGVAAAMAADPAGTYDVSGVSARDGSSYSGTARVEQSGAAYRITWDVGGKRFDGVGIMFKDSLAVAFRSGDATGIAAYESQGKGWKGVFAYLDGPRTGTEVWTQQAPPLSSVKAIFEKYNLIGVFAHDCTRPAKKEENWYYVNRLVDADHVQRDLMEGPTTRTWVVMIDKASELKPNEIAVSGMRDGKPVEGVWRVENGRMVQLEASTAGEKSVSGGKWLRTGHDMPWLNRCS